ncbi:MAG: RNB domain-containing ribonuclease [Proteobacteria bacterium]|nr:RNB domain-containing ribonuclease [Desulfobulbaceae bacterium]MBU4153222.1 RNB domain-containing ribonuclease [Pseudomonadota bacterium]
MQGKIIEYVEHGKFICAAIMEDVHQRLRLLNQNGREVNLPQARVVHQSRQGLNIKAAHDLIIKELQDTAKIRQQMTLPVALQDVWQLAIEEKELSFSPQFLADLCFGGTANDDQISAMIRAVFADPIYFKYRDDQIQVHTPEVVEQLLTKQETARQRQNMLLVGAEAIKTLWAGGIPTAWPEQDCLTIIGDHYLFDKETPHWEMARELLKEAGLTRPHDAFHLLVKAGRWQANENIPLLRHQPPVEFSEASMAQVKTIVDASQVMATTGRLDLRELPIITIDGASTRDFDDALHLRETTDGLEVGIHISDVACHVAPGTPLFKDAEQRATSIYFPDAIVPMLPRELSEGALSLIKDQDRAALSFLVTLSRDGEIKQSRIVRSLIRVKRQLSYYEAESQINSDRELALLADLSKKLLQRRISAGATIIPIPDVVFHFTEGRVDGIRLMDVDTIMRTLVSEFMVLANTLAASFLADRQEPGLYRTQEPPRKRLVQQPEHDIYINFKQRRFLARGMLLATPKRHAGVGVEQYTTTTSPIRRFLDLVIQHQISSILAGQGARFSEREMNEFSSLIASAQTKVNLVRQLRHRYWLFKFLENKKGEYLPALVLDVRNNKVQVVLQDYLFEGDLPANQAIRPEPGDTVRVRIAKVSPLDDTISFEW